MTILHGYLFLAITFTVNIYLIVKGMEDFANRFFAICFTIASYGLVVLLLFATYDTAYYIGQTDCLNGDLKYKREIKQDTVFTKK